MTSATLNLRVKEKRMLDKRDAAHYCGARNVKVFEAECPCAPVKIGNDLLYDKKELDQWLDSLSTKVPNTFDYEGIVARLA